MTGAFALFVWVRACVFVHEAVRAKSCPRHRKEKDQNQKGRKVFLALKSEKLLRVLQMPDWDFFFSFCFPLVSFTPLSVFSSFTRLDSNGCPVAPGNRIWPTVNHFVWFDRPCWQPLLLLLDWTSVSLVTHVHLQNTKCLIKTRRGKKKKMDYVKIMFEHKI